VSVLPITHITYQERTPVTALTLPHRHNGGTRLVRNARGEIFRYDERELIPASLRSRR
jgi:hypothetical protein